MIDRQLTGREMRKDLLKGEQDRIRIQPLYQSKGKSTSNSMQYYRQQIIQERHAAG